MFKKLFDGLQERARKSAKITCENNADFIIGTYCSLMEETICGILSGDCSLEKAREDTEKLGMIVAQQTLALANIKPSTTFHSAVLDGFEKWFVPYKRGDRFACLTDREMVNAISAQLRYFLSDTSNYRSDFGLIDDIGWNRKIQECQNYNRFDKLRNVLTSMLNAPEK